MPRLVRLSLILLLFLMLTACGSQVTETITEYEMNEELASDRIVADFKDEGVIVLTSLDQDVHILLTLEVEDGQLRSTVQEVVVAGISVPGNNFDEASEAFGQSVQEVFVQADVRVTDVKVTEDEIIITGRKP